MNGLHDRYGLKARVTALAALGVTALFGAVGCEDDRGEVPDARQSVGTVERYTYEERVVAAPTSDRTVVSGTSVAGSIEGDEEAGQGVSLDAMQDGLQREATPTRNRVLQRTVPSQNMNQEEMDRLVSRALSTREGRELVAPLFFGEDSSAASSNNPSSASMARQRAPVAQPNEAASTSSRTMTRANSTTYYGSDRRYPVSNQLDPDVALDDPDVLIDPTYDGTSPASVNDNAGALGRQNGSRSLTYESGVNPYTRSNQNSQVGNVGTTFQPNATLNSLGQGSVAVPQTPPDSAMPAQTTGSSNSNTTGVNANQTTGSVPQVPSRSSLPARTTGNGALGGPVVGPSTGGVGTAGY